MIYQGSGEVTLCTAQGEIKQHREVIVDELESTIMKVVDGEARHADHALKITVLGPPMKGLDEAHEIKVVTREGSAFSILLGAKNLEAAAEQTIFTSWEHA